MSFCVFPVFCVIRVCSQLLFIISVVFSAYWLICVRMRRATPPETLFVSGRHAKGASPTCEGPLKLGACNPHLAKTSGHMVFLAFITGGCSGRVVQWIGVVLYSKIVYNTVQINTPCFHCTPLCRM